MPYGIECYTGTSVKNLGQDLNGGRVFVKLIEQQWFSGQTYVFNIPYVDSGTSLKVFTVSPGSFTTTTGTNTTTKTASVILTAKSVNRGASARSAKIVVFTTATNEAGYGISTLNDSGERVASTIYPCAQFVQKLTYNATGSLYGMGQGIAGRQILSHSSNQNITGSGQLKIILYTIPENLNDCWYSFNSFIGTTSGYTDSIIVDAPIGAAYTMPEAYVFSLDSLTPSADTYGIRIYDNSAPQKLLFDSGNFYANIKGFETLNYTKASASSITSTLFSGNVPAFLIPQYGESIGTVSGNSTIFQEYVGCVKRIGTTLYSQTRLIDTYTEGEVIAFPSYTYGVTSNLCSAIDATILGAAPTPPLTGVITSTSTQTTCPYNIDVASSCTITEAFSVSYSGGGGGTISYSWSLSNTTDFSFLNGTTNQSTCSVVSNKPIGTYTGILYCQITDSISGSTTVSFNLSHVHTRTPLTATLTSSNVTNTCTLSGSTCITSETWTATPSGGSGTAKSYLWTIINQSTAGAFTATTANNTASYGIQVSAGAGTYTCNVNCRITQDGINYDFISPLITHTHSAQTYTVDLTGLNSTSNDLDITTIDGYLGLAVFIRLDGSWWIARQDFVGGQIYAVNSGTWISPTTANIGLSYYVRFTTVSLSGNGLGTQQVSPANGQNTGWLNIVGDMYPYLLLQHPSSTTTATRTVTFRTEISSSSTGSPILGTAENTLILRVSQP